MWPHFNNSYSVRVPFLTGIAVFDFRSIAAYCVCNKIVNDTSYIKGYTPPWFVSKIKQNMYVLKLQYLFRYKLTSTIGGKLLCLQFHQIIVNNSRLYRGLLKTQKQLILEDHTIAVHSGWNPVPKMSILPIRLFSPLIVNFRARDQIFCVQGYFFSRENATTLFSYFLTTNTLKWHF